MHNDHKKWLAEYSNDSIVIKALNYAKKAHEGVKRTTGEPYIDHCLAVAKMVNDWKLDDITIAAALLHDVVEDTDHNIKDIKDNFGDEVTFLVEGLTKLKTLKYKGNKEQAENMRKLVVATSQDLRVVFIKLADRWHNMQSVDVYPDNKKIKKAQETADIYAPLAYRLGMQWLSGELNDLAFPILYPAEYKWLLKEMDEHYKERNRYAEKVKPIIEKTLKKEGVIPIDVSARAKRYSSLYKKLIRYDMDLGRIHDLVALRIIVKNIEDCYATLGIIHKYWPPMPGRIKDYIALPKPNGYRSLHTTVFCVGNKITEVQIRTEDMHKEAEMGAAAHWAYAGAKDTKAYYKRKASHKKASNEELLWVTQLKSWQEQFKEPDEFLKSLKVDFFKDRIFVITPEHDVIDLPTGSTPVDFAYHIHSEIGDQCSGAKVNGKIVSLDYELRSGDMVEVLTQKGKRPSESWLDFVKTSTAQGHIRSSVKRKKQELLNPGQLKSGIEFRINSQDRAGLLRDIGNIFSKEKISIGSIVSSDNMNKGQHSIMVVKCKDLPQKRVEKLLLRIRQVPGVKEVSYRHSR